MLRSRRTRVAALCIALALLLPLSARTVQPSDIQSWIEREFAATRAASLTMAVAEDGRMVWAKSWGWADKERRIPATPQTLYSLASVTKPLAATGLMVLVERGLIDLDAPIDRYLGASTLRSYGGPAREATVRRVLNHTSGLPGYQHFFYDDEDRRVPAMDETTRRYGIIVHPPGEKLVYSNLGYGILQHAIAQVSKQTFAAYMQREVFGPLGMTRTGVGVPPELSAHQAVRYAGDGTRLPGYDVDHQGASSIYASAEDLVRLGFLHVKTLEPGQRRILTDASIDAMKQRTSPSSFGLGWRVLDGAASGVVFHGGGMDGVSTVLFLVPARRLVVVGLCSTGIDLPGRAAEQIINRMATGVRVAPPVASSKGGPIPETLTGHWRGELFTHNGRHPFRLSIEARGQLTGQLGDQPATSISSVEWIDGELRGSLVADLGVDDVRKPYRLRFGLTPRADRLEGAISAWAFRSGRAPDILPSFLSLSREP
jgi:CubicO group peptidase (beta-lactamase class C family)